MMPCLVPRLFLFHVHSRNTLSKLLFLRNHFPRRIYPPHHPRRNVLQYVPTLVISFLSVSFSHQPQSRRYQQQRVIPPEEDIRRLFQECKIARGNTDLLSQSLAFAKPDALDTDLIPVSSSSYHVRSLTNPFRRNSTLNAARPRN